MAIHFFLSIFLQYNACYVELPYPDLFFYLGFLKGSLQVLMLLLPYLYLFHFLIISPYNVKNSKCKSEYLSETNKNIC